MDDIELVLVRFERLYAEAMKTELKISEIVN